MTKCATRRPLLVQVAASAVLICFLFDIGLRFLPPRLFTFRAWEAVTLYATVTGRFAPRVVYGNPHAYGDLANLANLPRLRQYRTEIFSTDAEGHRNRREPARPFAGILLVGDSFTAGCGVSDDQTLSEQVSRITNLPVYNGAPVYSGYEATTFEELLSRLDMTRGLVVWQLSVWAPILTGFVPQHSWESRLVRKALGDKDTDELVLAYKYATAFLAYSPLRIVFGRAVKLLQNDLIFPNPYRSQVIAGRLSNGKEILFLKVDAEYAQLDRPADPAFFVQLQNKLQKKGIGLLVLLVPDKYTVYGDRLSPPALMTAPRWYLDTVAEHLAAAGVPVLNLTTDFRARAAALMSQGEYLYWTDDTHWNATGIREAAQAIAESSSVAGCNCR
jgi:SGNH hydrolase-like domain, acetyltransferase AlgX